MNNNTQTAIATAIELVAAGKELSVELAESVMAELMDGEAVPVQVAALLAMLHVRGETATELAAFARIMRARAVSVAAPLEAVDLCGTGADHSGSFNISTVASLVVAGAGTPVAKHGNRAITGQCGSADLVEALGIALDPGVERVQQAIREAGFGFMFAPAYHPATRHVMPIRRSLPMRTIFNLLGPLSSPAAVRFQLLGVADANLMWLIAAALSQLGLERALVVHGSDGLDELTLSGINRALLVEGDSITEMTIDPAALGFSHAEPASLLGGDVQRNLEIAQSVLAGDAGAARDAVLLNAGAALFVAGAASDVAEGLELAAAAIDSGRAAAVVANVAEVNS